MTFEDLWLKREGLLDKLNALRPMDSDAQRSQTKEEKFQIEELGRLLNKCDSVILGHPDSYDRVRCWMVDVVGSNSECSVSRALIDDIANDATQGLEHRYIEKFGSLASEVRTFVSQWNLTDSGGGGGFWHLGCKCTEAEAKELCSSLYVRFSHAIDCGGGDSSSIF